jgi:hypothetical protein
MDPSQDTYSLSELAVITGTGKARLRALIEAGKLSATRAEAARRPWIVRRDDALAAGLRFTVRDEVRRTATVRDPGGDFGVDAAMRSLLAEMLGPIETRLVRIESQNSEITALVDDLTGSRTEAHPRQITQRMWALCEFLRRYAARTRSKPVRFPRG